MDIYPAKDDPRDMPTQSIGSPTVVIAPSPAEAQVDRLKAIIHGLEGTLRNVRSRAQTGVVATSPVFMAHLFEEIDAMCALAQMGETEKEREFYDW